MLLVITHFTIFFLPQWQKTAEISHSLPHDFSQISRVDTANSTTKALIITGVTVINNVIQIKVSNAPTGSQVSGNDKLVVNLKTYTDQTGVEYKLTTVNGQQFSGNMAITINVDESKGAPIAELS